MRKQTEQIADWIDEATGYRCLIMKTPLGVLCGYVGIPERHPLCNVYYNDVEDIEVHGGLTFSDKISQLLTIPCFLVILSWKFLGRLVLTVLTEVILFLSWKSFKNFYRCGLSYEMDWRPIPIKMKATYGKNAKS